MNKTKVLVVEDEAVSRSCLTRMLADPEYEIESAGSVEEAVRRAKAFRPDVLVLDWLLPDGTGLDVAEQVRSWDATARFVFLSGFSCEELRGDARHLQPAAVLAKPVANEHIRQAVHEAAGLTRA